jgi:hypothetical protein
VFGDAIGLSRHDAAHDFAGIFRGAGIMAAIEELPSFAFPFRHLERLEPI